MKKEMLYFNSNEVGLLLNLMLFFNYTLLITDSGFMVSFS